MTGRFAGAGWRIGGKLLLVAAAGAAAVHVSGLPARAPDPVPALRPVVSAPAPASVRVVAPDQPVAPAKFVPVAAKPAVANMEFEIKRVLDVPEPIRIGDWHWDEAGVPPGQIVITADLEAGTLSVFRGGYEIGTAAIIYGIDYKPTPTGLFTITQKDRDHISNLYDAPMPYMMRLTNDGITIHGSDVRDGAATHGCIGVPMPFAAKLFAATKLGVPVLVTNGGLRPGSESLPKA